MTVADFLKKWSSQPSEGAAAQVVADDVARSDEPLESPPMPGQPRKTVDDFRRERLMQALRGSGG
jgi:hypothetical protein